MSAECTLVHHLTNALERHRFPFDGAAIPDNGIYVLFQQGESGHGLDRVVRIGTHTGSGQLRPRLAQHFMNPNKDRSIFRKNIGRALLNQRQDPFLKAWELDLTSRKARERFAGAIDFDYQSRVETEVSEFIRNNFSFAVFEVRGEKERIAWESKLISTLSRCDECTPSDGWLGRSSPKEKIVRSGLWLVNELYKTPLTPQEAAALEAMLKGA